MTDCDLVRLDRHEWYCDAHETILVGPASEPVYCHTPSGACP